MAAALAALLLLAPAAPAAAAAAKAAKISPAEVRVTTPVYSLSGDLERNDEVWRYGFSWSGIPVGEIAIESRTLAADASAGKRLAIHAWGRTNSFVDFFWRYRLDARGTIRLDPFGPAEFYAVEEEKSKKKLTRIEFSEDGKLSAERRKGDRVSEYHFEAPNTYDIVSTVFLTLSFDYEIGQEYLFDVFTGTSRYLVPIKVEGRDIISAAGESVDAYRLKVSTRALTDPDDDSKHRETHLWVSAVKPRRLLKARSKTFIGAVYVDLESVAKLAPAAATDAGKDPAAAGGASGQGSGGDDVGPAGDEDSGGGDANGVPRLSDEGDERAVEQPPADEGSAVKKLGIRRPGARPAGR